MNEEELFPVSARRREFRLLALGVCWTVAGVGLAAFADGAEFGGVGPETALVATPGVLTGSLGRAGPLALAAAVTVALLVGVAVSRAAE